tara:strand:+ start:616 stop:933 length:318 start_codon:yes stop_codon:yes gene_type:complete
MINFKLAEYKDGNLKAFISLSKKGIFTHEEVQEIEEDEAFLIGDGNIVTLRKLGHDSICETYFLDKKDPLNRFDGLFDGRTYGNGMFVLVDEEFIKKKHNKFNLF